MSYRVSLSRLRCISLFTSVIGVERFTLLLFNLCVATILTEAAYSVNLTVVNSVYLVLQTLPLAFLALKMGVWLDNTDRTAAMKRILLVKVGGVSLTLIVSSAVLASGIKIGVIVLVPLMMFLVMTSAIINCMHLVLHLATERIWVVVASQREDDSSSFLTQSNSAMMLGQDIGQVLGLLIFTKLSDNNIELFLVTGFIIIVLSLVQWISLWMINKKSMPPDISCVNGMKRTIKISIMDYITHKDAPVGLCWTARTTFTAVWFASTIMEHSPISLMSRWFFTVTNIVTSITYSCTVPRISAHIILITTAVGEIIAVLLAVCPVLADKVQGVYFNNTTLIDMTKHVSQHTSAGFTLNDMIPKMYGLGSYILLAFGMVLGVTCDRVWNLTALQVYQEGVGPRNRGSFGGVQMFLNYVALSFHGLLAIMIKGSGYIWTCAVLGVILSTSSLLVLLWWRRVRIKNSERVHLIRGETHLGVCEMDNDL